MDERQKTTVYLDRADYRALKKIARARGYSAADALRDAVHEYTERYAVGAAPRSIGLGHSGRGDIAERDEKLLDGFGGDG